MALSYIPNKVLFSWSGIFWLRINSSLKSPTSVKVVLDNNCISVTETEQKYVKAREVFCAK